MVETMIAVLAMGAASFVILSAISIGHSAQDTVSRSVSASADMREAHTRLAQELKGTSNASPTVAMMGEGNHQLTFQQAIVVGGDIRWGVDDRALGPASANQEGWSYRYTEAVVDGTRYLARQLVDAEEAVRHQELVLGGLRGGQEEPRGFEVLQIGDIWEIRIATEDADGAVQNTVFHVKTRN